MKAKTRFLFSVLRDKHAEAFAAATFEEFEAARDAKRGALAAELLDKRRTAANNIQAALRAKVRAAV